MELSWLHLFVLSFERFFSSRAFRSQYGWETQKKSLVIHALSSGETQARLCYSQVGSCLSLTAQKNALFPVGVA